MAVETLEIAATTSGADTEQVRRMNILGVGISTINMKDAVELSHALIRSERKSYICVTDVHTVIEAQSDAGLRSILNSSFLTTPDGVPLVWIGRMLGYGRLRRVYGPDFLIEMCKVSAKRKYRHFFFGGKPGVAQELAKQLGERFPGLEIAGTYTPPFRALTADEERDLEEQIRQAEPDILWVGLGSPKQERFMAQYCGRLDARLMVGVGAAFDIHSGAVKEAPQWIKNMGLQWLHRLIQEPRRLWKRYSHCIPSFLWGISLQLLGIRRFRIGA
jgi:N-acetylglucosaminyldiphosphoundecaprenol N-acetyl-beta-D-mannosaminyltransferase